MESNSESRFLLTGATGFIGQAVVPILIAEGAEVMALTTKPTEVVEQWGIQAVDLLKVPEKAILDRVKTFAPEVLLHLGWSGLPEQNCGRWLVLGVRGLAGRVVRELANHIKVYVHPSEVMPQATA